MTTTPSTGNGLVTVTFTTTGWTAVLLKPARTFVRRRDACESVDAAMGSAGTAVFWSISYVCAGSTVVMMKLPGRVLYRGFRT